MIRRANAEVRGIQPLAPFGGFNHRRSGSLTGLAVAGASRQHWMIRRRT